MREEEGEGGRRKRLRKNGSYLLWLMLLAVSRLALLGSVFSLALGYWPHSSCLCLHLLLCLQSAQSSDTQSGQESGLPSAFLAELEAVSDGCNAMKLSVTREVIEAIFRTYPSVKAKHAELVPDQMREEDFWVQFFQSQRFHGNLSSKSKNLLSSCLTEELKGVWGVREGAECCVCVCVCVCVCMCACTHACMCVPATSC